MSASTGSDSLRSGSANASGPDSSAPSSAPSSITRSAMISIAAWITALRMGLNSGFLDNGSLAGMSMV